MNVKDRASFISLINKLTMQESEDAKNIIINHIKNLRNNFESDFIDNITSLKYDSDDLSFQLHKHFPQDLTTEQQNTLEFIVKKIIHIVSLKLHVQIFYETNLIQLPKSIDTVMGIFNNTKTIISKNDLQEPTSLNIGDIGLSVLVIHADVNRIIFNQDNSGYGKFYNMIKNISAFGVIILVVYDKEYKLGYRSENIYTVLRAELLEEDINGKCGLLLSWNQQHNSNHIKEIINFIYNKSILN